MTQSCHSLQTARQRLQVLRAGLRHDDTVPVILERQDQMIELMETVVDNVERAAEIRQEEYAELSARMAVVETEVKTIAQNVNLLCKVVRDGNGQPSLVQRLTATEVELHSYNSRLREVEQNANSIIASRMLTRTQLVVGISGMLFTALTATAALVATLIK